MDKCEVESVGWFSFLGKRARGSMSPLPQEGKRNE